MASSYTDIGTELMTTGENAGNWGTKTNTNLQILEEALRGYVSQSIAGGVQTTALTYTDGTVGDAARNMIIALTGSITGNQTVTVTAKEKLWVIDNQTSGAYTVNIKVSGQTGVTWGASDKGTKILYCNGTDVIDTGISSTGAFDLNGGELTLDADSDTSITASTDDQIDFEIAGADDFTMTANAFNVLTGSHVTFADSANAKFGTSNDMLMYHDGTNSYITNAVGALKIATETSGIALTIGHTTSETTIADNLTTTGNLSVGGDLDVTGSFDMSDANITNIGSIALDTITNDGTDITLDSSGDIVLDADGADILLKDDGTTFGALVNDSGKLDIKSGSTPSTAISIESDLKATFTADVAVGDNMYFASDAPEVRFGGSQEIKIIHDHDKGLILKHTATADDKPIVFTLQTGETDIAASDILGSINFQAPDEGTGTDAILVAAGIEAVSEGDFSSSNNATKLSFKTAASEAAAEKMSLSSAGVLTVSGAITSSGIVTGTGFTAGSAVLAEAELELLDGLTAGTAIASKVVTTDSSIDTTGQRNLTISGELDAATLDISSSIDIAGASQFSGAVTVGVDDTGLDVKFFGASAGAYMEWDESIDTLRIIGASADATTSTGKLLLATSLTDINASDVLGKIDFQAPLEAGGTDAITVAASIQAMAQGTFSASVNATDLLFFTGHSEAATEKFRFTSQGELGVGGANYGTDGQVLTSTGAGTAPAWEAIPGASALAADDLTAGDAAVTLSTSSGNITVDATANNTDIIFKGTDATADITMLTLDGSEAGAATFNDKVIATELDISGNMDIDGTSNLDAVDIDGAVQIDAAFTSGVDGQGYDTKFFGDTASAYIMWDTSADKLLTAGGALVDIVKDKLMIGGTAVTTTAAELNKLDGAGVTTAEIDYNDIATLGTSAASKTLTADANNLSKITGAIYIEEATLSFDATQDWDVRASPVAQVTLTANVTFDAPSNPTTGQYISVVCIQDGTGSRTIAWNAVFEFTGGTAPTATTTAGKADLFTFRYHNSHWIEVGRNLNLTRA